MCKEIIEPEIYEGGKRMSFVITGDTHGTLDLPKVVQYFDEHDGEYTEDDYLIILGDVGVCGFSASEERVTRETLRNLPVTTLFIDGNHENFEHLNSPSPETIIIFLLLRNALQRSDGALWLRPPAPVRHEVAATGTPRP